MDTLNDIAFLQKFRENLKLTQYGVFGIFRDKTSQALGIGFGEDGRHVTLRRQMEDGRREMIGWGVITYENGGYKMIGRTSNAHDYPELPIEFMHSISAEICLILQTDSLSIPVRGDVVKIGK